jgi:hypothetical protein
MCGKRNRYDEADPYDRARKKVDQKKGFYKHLAVYVVVNLFITLTSIFSGDFPDSIPMAFFWGMGLAIHYFNVFGFGPSRDPQWEEREIDRELYKMGYERRDGKVHAIDIDERLQKRERGTRYDESELV